MTYPSPSTAEVTAGVTAGVTNSATNGATLGCLPACLISSSRGSKAGLCLASHHALAAHSNCGPQLTQFITTALRLHSPNRELHQSYTTRLVSWGAQDVLVRKVLSSQQIMIRKVVLIRTTGPINNYRPICSHQPTAQNSSVGYSSPENR